MAAPTANHKPPPPSRAFLAGGGEMGALMRGHDWSTSSLGEPDTWPQALRTIVRLMLNTGHPMFVFWGADGACLYNDAYRASIGPERHPGALGRPAHEVWDEIWTIIGPQIDQVMAGRGATWHENQLVPITRNGRLEDVYWTYSYSPIDDESAAGGIGGVLVTVTETTQAILAEQRRAREAERQRWLFDQAPGFIIVMRGPDHVVEFVNNEHRELFGSHDWTGRTIREAFPSIADQGFFEVLDKVYATGETIEFQSTEVNYKRSPDAAAESRYMTFIYAPLLGQEGEISGIFCEGFDVTPGYLAQLSEQRQRRHLQLLVDELNHRVKNTLAIVQGMAQQYFRADGGRNPAREAFEGRLMALAAAHDFLTDQRWQYADLADLVAKSVEALGASGDRVGVVGPSIRLAPKTAVTFALTLHELATNARKYGALSTDQGRVDISWSLRPEDHHLVLTWTESGGPVVAAPARTGFGARMIERALASEQDGSVAMDFRPTGLVCTFQATLPDAESLEDARPLALPA